MLYRSRYRCRYRYRRSIYGMVVSQLGSFSNETITSEAAGRVAPPAAAAVARRCMRRR